MIFENRWYQKGAENAFFDYYLEGNEGNQVLAMPGGTGKSWVIAMIVKRMFEGWPNTRVMMLTHVKELIEQNAEKLELLWPTAPMGIYSAGLNKRDKVLPIIYGGVQSVANEIERSLKSESGFLLDTNHFGYRDILFIDECHLVSPKDATKYQYVISELKKINPFLKVVGLTATHYRLDQGLLIEDDGIFTDISYDITDVNSYNRLLNEGFLSPLIAHNSSVKIDTSQFKINRGEYNQKEVESAFEKIMFEKGRSSALTPNIS